MNPTLRFYEKLKSSDSIKDDLGCALPSLTGATLVSQSTVCSAQKLAETLSKWHNAQGWYQTHDQTTLGMPTELSTLLEGEWFVGNRSLSVRWLCDGQYQVTEIAQQSSESNGFCYQDQPIWLRGNLCTDSVNCVIYRQWFQLSDHSYKPVVSQFVGFTYIKE